MRKDYKKHSVFKLLKEFAEFYDNLSYSSIDHMPEGMPNYNIDTHAFSSIQGTIESMRFLLLKGRIGDAFALLRKYNDAIHVNTYANLLLIHKFDIFGDWVVDEIRRWLAGQLKITEDRKTYSYIMNAKELAAINNLIKIDNRYAIQRDRGNDFTHYNLYDNFLLNDNEIYNDAERIIALDNFKSDAENLFIMHFAYVVTLREEYMSANAYVEYLESGQTPPEDCQYWVAAYIQETFNKHIKKHRKDIADLIIAQTAMHLK